jgi:hypothetical protein
VVGKVLAKCLVDQQLSTVSFVAGLYKQLLLRSLTVQDLEDVDKELYQSLGTQFPCFTGTKVQILTQKELLEWILECNADEEDLGIYMCIDIKDTHGNYVTIDLVQGGRDIEVTEANKATFVDKMLRWRLVDRVAVQMDALVSGFHSVLPFEFVEAFEPAELQVLLCGCCCINVDDWRSNTLYCSGYAPESPVIQWFWELVNKMKNEERLSLLHFVTGTGALPPGGFAHLLGSDGERRFSILRVTDDTRLPQSHTCFNQLLLPEYKCQQEFEAKMTRALGHVADGILLR